MKITQKKLKQIIKEEISVMEADYGALSNGRQPTRLARSELSKQTYLFAISVPEILDTLRDVVEFLEPIDNEETKMEDYEGSELRSLEGRLEQALMDFKNMVQIHEKTISKP